MKKPSVYLLLLAGLLLALFPAAGQGGMSDSLAPPRSHNRLDVFPAISYSPETKLTSA
ncbi:MAG: hypothetical protein IPJ82_08775 [Lewinellaceae bacterium]|nr:hypothetical protein [Lewinellaceae bacterium]